MRCDACDTIAKRYRGADLEISKGGSKLITSVKVDC